MKNKSVSMSKVFFSLTYGDVMENAGFLLNERFIARLPTKSELPKIAQRIANVLCWSEGADNIIIDVVNGAKCEACNETRTAACQT